MKESFSSFDDFLSQSASLWSQQRIPETREACLWDGSDLEQAVAWAKKHLDLCEGESRAFLIACLQKCEKHEHPSLSSMPEPPWARDLFRLSRKPLDRRTSFGVLFLLGLLLMWSLFGM